MEEKLRLLYIYCIGAIRYTKYRKRGKHFRAYKFYRAQCEHYFRKLCEKEAGETKTKVEIYMILDQLPNSASQQKYLYPENEQAMNKLYLELLDAMLDEERSTIPVNHLEALTEIITFVRAELELFQ